MRSRLAMITSFRIASLRRYLVSMTTLLCATPLWAECQIGVYRPSGFLMSRKAIIVVITNIGLERTSVSFDIPGPPFKFAARVKQGTFQIDRRETYSPPITYGIPLKETVWLEPNEKIGFYINLSADLVLVDPPKLVPLGRLIARERAEIIVETDFFSPGSHGFRFSLTLSDGRLVGFPTARYNVRKTRHGDHPTVSIMDSRPSRQPIFDRDDRPLFR